MAPQPTQDELKETETAQPRYHAQYGADGDDQHRGQHDEGDQGNCPEHHWPA